jgi:hypothetical protein
MLIQFPLMEKMETYVHVTCNFEHVAFYETFTKNAVERERP